MKPKIYFTKNQENIGRLYEAVKSGIKGKNIALKTHFGEAGNITHLDPALVRIISDKLKESGFDHKLIESNVLYQGRRLRADSHLQVALEHGFDFAPIDIYDDRGLDDCLKAEVPNGKHFKEAYLIKNLADYDFLVVVSHFKGHVSAGFGGTIKNLSMGLACRRGKLAMHSAFKPEVGEEKCIACGACIKNCPVQAISLEEKAHIDQDVCIGCAGCVAVCPQKAIEAFSADNIKLQERLAEYALASVGIMPAVYFNFIVNVTSHCDCHGAPDEVLIPEVGYLAGTDPVAIDQASFDLIKELTGDDFFERINNISGDTQLAYGEKMGLGRREYELIEI